MICPNPDCPDLVLSGVRGEYVDGIGECPRCGTRLVERLPVEDASARAPAGPPVGELEEVFETSDPTEIPVVRSLLEAAGIPFLTRGEEGYDALRGARSAFRLNPRAGVVVFVVPSELAEDARALLVEVEIEEEGP